jgi:predicted nucleic acid-binding protein
VLVVDATVAVVAANSPSGFDHLANERLVAPPLMWPEARSALHEAAWRGEITAQDAERARSALESCPVEERQPDGLGAEAWRIADELGWAKTYDAEYVALARLLGCRVVTLDERLRRGADRLGIVISPTELGP